MPSVKHPVSIHPYFRVRPGQMASAKALLREFLARVGTETGTLSYDFTIGGDVVFCRESYLDADALLAHVTNVGPLVEKMLGLSTLDRVEVHGPAAELEKLKGPLAGLNPTYFACECGVDR